MQLRDRVIQCLSETEASISGQKLADEFQVSRNAIWKVIQQLKQEGYQIESDRVQGYRLESSVNQIEPALIQRIWPNLVIEYQHQVTSTNDLAKEYIIKHPNEHYLLIASKQIAGRGRRGKSFQSDLTHGLYFTLAYKVKNQIAPESLPLFTLLASTAMAQALEEYLTDRIQIKWVNDLFYQSRKVAGILTEVTMDIETGSYSHVVIGIGVNLAGHFETSQPEVEKVAGTIFGESLPKTVNLNELVNLFLLQFDYYAKHFDEKRFMNEYQKRLLGLDCQVDYQLDNRKQTGIIRGIDEHGNLLMENQSGEVESLYGMNLTLSSIQFIERGYTQ
ncbi:biotin--[acetyl-CoA-carboxylase] ligase [Aerococcaceae bacterium DSM 111020]|nr:biotin--[acetyl-CoA-carboxylase] ligase [Aerococcaceae bacterium DSM 111020]